MDDAGEMEDDNDVMLATISRHQLSLGCSCGHTGVVSVQDCLVTFGLRATVAEVAGGTRCGECGEKDAKTFKVIYGGQKGRRAAREQ